MSTCNLALVYISISVGYDKYYLLEYNALKINGRFGGTYAFIFRVE
jgi:hypothetical protein